MILIRSPPVFKNEDIKNYRQYYLWNFQRILPRFQCPSAACRQERRHPLHSACNRKREQLQTRNINTPSKLTHNFLITPSYREVIVTAALSLCTSQRLSNWETVSPTLTCLKAKHNICKTKQKKITKNLQPFLNLDFCDTLSNIGQIELHNWQPAC